MEFLISGCQCERVKVTKERPSKRKERKKEAKPLWFPWKRKGESWHIPQSLARLALLTSFHFISLFIKWLCIRLSVFWCQGALEMIQEQSDLFRRSPVPPGTPDVGTPPLCPFYGSARSSLFLIKAPAPQGQEVPLHSRPRSWDPGCQGYTAPEPGGRLMTLPTENG